MLIDIDNLAESYIPPILVIMYLKRMSKGVLTVSNGTIKKTPNLKGKGKWKNNLIYICRSMEIDIRNGDHIHLISHKYYRGNQDKHELLKVKNEKLEKIKARNVFYYRIYDLMMFN